MKSGEDIFIMKLTFFNAAYLKECTTDSSVSISNNVTTLEIKEAVHQATMELVEDCQRDFFYYPFASGGVVHFLIVLYPHMQLRMHGEETLERESGDKSQGLPFRYSKLLFFLTARSPEILIVGKLDTFSALAHLLIFTWKRRKSRT